MNPDPFLDGGPAAGAIALVPRHRSGPPGPPARPPITDAPFTDAPATDALANDGPLGGAPLGEAPLLKRTYKIRPDQDAAMAHALALQTTGRDVAHGADRSAIVRRLLDLHGYNAAYVRGDGALR